MGMTIHSFYRSIAYCIITIFCISFMSWLAPAPIFNPQGIFLPAGRTLQPTELSDVVLYPYEPSAYQTLGEINIKSHFQSVSPSDEEKTAVETYAKSLAAKAGADGIIVSSYGETGPSSGPSDRLIVFAGKVIHRSPL